MTQTHEPFIRRCFDLARLGADHVAPNPMVGAVLVYEGRIIGEGWHQQYGGPHAEVNCVASVHAENQAFISKSTLYCSLEPCFHYGKTPPCVELVLAQKIPRVVISNLDPNPLVAGQSIQKLRDAGVEVLENVLEAEGRRLNCVFFKWIESGKPYIVLKWAQSSDGFLGIQNQRTAISGPAAQRLVHRWRSELSAILVGHNTALVDNPRLDTRLHGGRAPLRIAYDRAGTLPPSQHLLDDSIETWIFGPQRPGDWQRTQFKPFENRVEIPDLLQQLAEARKSSLLVEGGAEVLQQFLDAGGWDEIRVITGSGVLGDGVAAPRVPAGAKRLEWFGVGEDWVEFFEK